MEIVYLETTISSYLVARPSRDLILAAHQELTREPEVRPRKAKRGVDLISDALPFGRLWYTQFSDAVSYAEHRSRSHDAVIRVYDEAGNVIETHEHAGHFKAW